jgi:hypothetical protein
MRASGTPDRTSDLLLERPLLCADLVRPLLDLQVAEEGAPGGRAQGERVRLKPVQFFFL